MILLIEDESRWATRFTKALDRDGGGAAAQTYDRAEALLAALPNSDDGDVRVICFDQDLASEGRGSDLLRQVRETHGDAHILLGVTSSTDPDDLDRFVEAGANGMASKAGLRNGLGGALADLHNGNLLSEQQADLFREPAGFIHPTLVARG